ncbi:MAG: TlpA family protein disulfide reductase, partial [Planctomycetota bacterium]
MNPGMRTLMVLSLVFLVAATRPVLDASPDPGVEARIEAMEELYQAARKQGFRDSEALQELQKAAEAFIAAADDSTPAATLATARAYRLRCRLSAEAYEEVYATATALLDRGGLVDNDRAKLLYYRGVSAAQTDRRDAANDCVVMLKSLKPDIAAALQGRIAQKWPPVVSGQAPPAWTLPLIPAKGHQGLKDPLTLSDLKGKYVLLDFWATWCGPCRAVMKNDLAPLHKEWADDDRFELVSVGTNWSKDTAEKQATFADQNGYRWTKVFDGDGSVTGSYGVRGIPTLT